MIRLLALGLIALLVSACHEGSTGEPQPIIVELEHDSIAHDTSTTVVDIAPCDTFAMDRMRMKDPNSALGVWLETTSLSWFLENRQSTWREAKAWHVKTAPVDSNALASCLAKNRKDIFLYIPNHFHVRKRNGNEYIRLLIINNSNNTVPIPRIDSVIDSVTSSVALGDSATWRSFQATNGSSCGNSYFRSLLPPHSLVEVEVECDYIGMGSSLVDYRLELTLAGRTLVSNTIQIPLMNAQLRYMGKPFDQMAF